jgi:hypothetical protein
MKLLIQRNVKSSLTRYVTVSLPERLMVMDPTAHQLNSWTGHHKIQDIAISFNGTN